MHTRLVLSVLLTLAALPVGACDSPGNLVRNCGFDEALAAWTVQSGSCTVDAQVGGSRPGSAVCASAAQNGVNRVALHQCVPAGAGTYVFSADAQRLSERNLDCSVVAASHRTADCTALTDLAGAALSPDGARFVRSATQSLKLDASARALSLDIACMAAAPFVVSIDDVLLLPDLIFKNGFEPEPPVLTAGATLNYTENQAASVVDATVTVSDVDSTTLASATVQISANYQSGADSLAFTPAGAITGSFSTGSGTLTLTGTDTLANYQAALRSVTFVNPSDDPSAPARTITWIANDGVALPSSPVTSTVNLTAVNDAPVLAAGGGSPTFTEDGAAVAVDAAITATDVDNTNFASATVTLTNRPDGAAESLAATPVGGIVAAYTPATGVLSLTGSASVANYRTTLRSVVYANSSQNPTMTARSIGFVVNDGSSSSNTASKSVAVIALNDPPVVGNAPSYAVTANIAITQPDDATNDLLGTARTIGDADSAGPFTIAAASLGPRATVQGGTVNIAANGSFSYSPPLNFAGPTDTVSYQVCDAGTPLPAACTPVTITFNITGPAIVFVDDSAAAGGNGTLQAPLRTIAAGIAALGSGAGSSNLFLFSGNYPQTATQTLPNNARLFGQGSLVANFDTLYAIVPSALSIARPALSQARPTISSGTVACLTLGSNNTLRGFEIDNCVTDALVGTNFGTLTVPSDNLVINNGSGRALNLTTGVGAATFASVSSAGSATQGINLDGVTGTVTISAGAITNATGTDFNINAGTAAVSYAGTITDATGRLVSVTNSTGGTKAFSGAITDSGGGTGTGISLSTNTGATITFSGGISLSTGANAAFTATGGGTVSATQNNTTIVNTLATTGGTALNVANTTIGASGLTFRSISSGTAANSAPNGIILDTTGASGGLTVTGNASAGSGGTIQHKTGADGSTTQGSGIFLNNTRNVSLDRMQLNDFQNYGIVGTTVTGFTLNNTVINGTNGTNVGGVGEGNVYFTGLSGSAAVSNSQFSGGILDTFHVFNNGSENLNRITITNCSFTMTNTTGGDALVFQATGGTFNATVQSSTISAARSDLFQLNLLGTVSSDLVFGGATVALGNTLTNSNTNIVSGGGGVTIGGGGPTNNITLTYNISHNSIRGSHGAVIALFKGTGTGASFTGTIDSNTIGQQGVVGSGSTQGEGIAVFQDGAGTINTTITNNHVSGVVGGRGAIDLYVRNGAAGTMRGVVQGNIVDTLDQANSFAGMYFQTGSGTGAGGDNNKSCLTIGGAGALKNSVDIGANTGGALVAGFTVEQEGVSRVGLLGTPNYAGAAYNFTAIQNYVAANNTFAGSNGQAVFAFGDATTPAAGGYFGACPP